MKEYDIFLKKQPEGEIIVYMLAYYTHFSVKNGLLIDVEAYEKALKKLSISNNVGLEANVLGTNKRAFEQLQNGIGITASQDFFVKKIVENVETNVISIDIPKIDITPVIHDVHFNGASAVELAAYVNAVLKRYRLLIELDNNCILNSMTPLLDIDNNDILTIDNRSLLDLMFQISAQQPFIDTTLIQGYVPLQEMDAKSLTDIDEEILDRLYYTIPLDLPYIDNMTLEELDYVIEE